MGHDRFGKWGGLITRDLSLIEGDTYALKARAIDRQGNVGGDEGSLDEILTLAVPYDDANAGMSYTGTWTTSSDLDQFVGTVRSAGVGATVSFEVTSAYGATIMVVGGPSEAWIRLEGDGNSREMSEKLSDHKGGVIDEGSAINYITVSEGTHTVTIDVIEGVFLFDGLAVFRD